MKQKKNKLERLKEILPHLIKLFNDKVEVTIDDDTLECGDFVVTLTDDKLYVSQGYVVPGVRYYKDGSGQHDDYDYKDLGVFDNPVKAVECIADKMWQDWKDGYFQAESDREMDFEFDKYAEEMDRHDVDRHDVDRHDVDRHDERNNNKE